MDNNLFLTEEDEIEALEAEEEEEEFDEEEEGIHILLNSLF